MNICWEKAGPLLDVKIMEIRSYKWLIRWKNKLASLWSIAMYIKSSIITSKQKETQSQLQHIMIFSPNISSDEKMNQGIPPGSFFWLLLLRSDWFFQEDTVADS
jgi:hypothetical protein